MCKCNRFFLFVKREGMLYRMAKKTKPNQRRAAIPRTIVVTRW